MLPPYIPTRSIPFAGTAAPRAVFAGRLTPEKGAAEAIDIARIAGLQIDVFGDPYDAGYFREQIDPDGLSRSGGPRGRRDRPLEGDGRASVVLSPCAGRSRSAWPPRRRRRAERRWWRSARGGLAEVIATV